jgi:hypothetical protein
VSKYEIIDSESAEYFDILIEAGFAKPLVPAQTVQLLQTITDVFTDKIAQQLCQQISLLRVTETDLTLQVRYATAESPEWKPDVSSRAKTQFLFYVLAKIDRLCPIGDAPFPDGWREWLDFPKHIERFGYENG